MSLSRRSPRPFLPFAAARSLLPMLIYVNQVEFWRDNVAINDNVMYWAKEYGVKKLVSCLSTCALRTAAAVPPSAEIQGYLVCDGRRECSLLPIMLGKLNGPPNPPTHSPWRL